MEARRTSRRPLGSRASSSTSASRARRRCEYAAVPTLGFELRDREPRRSSRSARSCSTCRSRSPPAGAPTTRTSSRGCCELFGEPHRWSTTLRTLPWLRTTQVVPALHRRDARRACSVPCTYDFEVTAAKYLAALDDGEVPLEFLFSGTVFYTAASGALQTAMIGWDREAEYRLPVAVWRETMDHYFPGSAWLRLRARHVRPPARLPRAARAAELGARRSTACSTAARRSADDGPGRSGSPTRCSTRATCCGPTAGRRSKNQRRWTFGGVYPRAHSAAHPDDPCVMQTQCLRRGRRDCRVDVRVRFLHVVERGVARRRAGASRSRS